jgi:retron-type reverse transcriptase
MLSFKIIHNLKRNDELLRNKITANNPMDGMASLRKVRANKGGAVIDEMDWETMDKNRKSLLYKLWNRPHLGSYFPPPVKEVGIKKKGGAQET